MSGKHLYERVKIDHAEETKAIVSINIAPVGADDDTGETMRSKNIDNVQCTE